MFTAALTPHIRLVKAVVLECDEAAETGVEVGIIITNVSCAQRLHLIHKEGVAVKTRMCSIHLFK